MLPLAVAKRPLHSNSFGTTPSDLSTLGILRFSDAILEEGSYTSRRRYMLSPEAEPQTCTTQLLLGIVSPRPCYSIGYIEEGRLQRYSLQRSDITILCADTQVKNNQRDDMLISLNSLMNAAEGTASCFPEFSTTCLKVKPGEPDSGPLLSTFFWT